MKANFTNLRKALKASADAHKVEFNYWKNDGVMTLKSDSIPVLSDARMICDAFYGNHDMVDVSWGYTEVFLGESKYLPQVDAMTLSFALPSGTVL